MNTLRRLTGMFGTLALAGALCATAPATACAAAAAPPNIIILYADDMGFGDLGANNPASKIPTPHLDRLATQGLRLTDAHSSSGICTPSRYALLTGRFHWRKLHHIVGTFGPPELSPNELTLPELLKQAGYQTACIGKWHLGWNWADLRRPGSPRASIAPEDFDWSKPIGGGPLAHGFDYYFGDDVPNFPPYAWIENDRLVTVPSVPLELRGKPAEGSWEARPGPMTPGWDFTAVVPRLKDETVKWIAAQSGKRQPFFLYVPFNSPHAPIVPAPEFAGTSQAGGYGDFVAQTDACVGAILAALESAGLAANTLVIFSADNGAEHYAYERLRKFNHASSGPFRGVKRDLYEGGHHVPMLVRWPGNIPPASVSSQLTSQVDLFATIAAAAGIEVPATAAEDSYNLLPHWRNPASQGPRHTIVHNTKPGNYALRLNDWLLVAAPTGTQTPVPEWYNQQFNHQPNTQAGELYDLAKDPAQQHNLYQDQPDKVRELTTELEKIRATGQVRPGQPRH